MTPSEIGERAEAAILSALVQAQKHVVLPFSGHRRYDLAYEQNGRLIKVQCKSAREKNGALTFRTCSYVRGARRDYRDDVDVFGVYCHDRGEVYLVPVQDVPCRGASLRLHPARNGQTSGIRDATDYLVRGGRLPDVVEQPIFQGIVESTFIDSGVDVAIPLPLESDRTSVACCGPLADPGLDGDAAHATAALFKALGDPQRVRVVNLLTNAGEAVCVCDITGSLGLSQSTVSFHLKKLVNAGLLHREQRGTWAYYSIDHSAMRTLRTVVSMKGGAP